MLLEMPGVGEGDVKGIKGGVGNQLMLLSHHNWNSSIVWNKVKIFLWNEVNIFREDRHSKICTMHQLKVSSILSRDITNIEYQPHFRFLFFPLNLLFDWINFNSLSVCLNSSLIVAICDNFSSLLSFGTASLLIIDAKSGTVAISIWYVLLWPQCLPT